jgi:hypothetical protein
VSSFALDLQRFAERTGRKADLAVGSVVVRVAAELDKRSPVGDATYWEHPAPKGYVGGRFRGNWQLGVGVVPSGETGVIDKTGAETQGRIIATIPEDASGKVYFLWNNVPYGQRIEDGWSRQAPQGVVGLTAVMFQGIVNDAVKALAA